MLKWKEPRYAQKYAVKQLTAKDYLTEYGKFIWKWIVGSFVVFSIIRWLSPREVNSFFDLEILSIVLVVVVAMSLIWLIYAAANSETPEISLREKDVLYMSISGAVKIRYKDIQSCSIGKANFNEQEFNFLEIKHYDGNVGYIEVDPSIKIEEIIEILKNSKVQVKSSLLNPI